MCEKLQFIISVKFMATFQQFPMTVKLCCAVFLKIMNITSGSFKYSFLMNTTATLKAVTAKYYLE